MNVRMKYRVSSVGYSVSHVYRGVPNLLMHGVHGRFDWPNGSFNETLACPCAPQHFRPLTKTRTLVSRRVHAAAAAAAVRATRADGRGGGIVEVPDATPTALCGQADLKAVA